MSEQARKAAVRQIALSDNVHPNCDGSPWGWIVYKDSPRTRIATYGGYDEKAGCEAIAKIVNAHAEHTADLREKKFKRGDRVRKINGSSWRGIVVGEYSTEFTPEGYAVESKFEKNSVQIYPAAALEKWIEQEGEDAK